MLIVWGGHGYLVPAATFTICLATEYATGRLSADEKYYQEQAWPVSFALVAAAIASYRGGKHLNRPATDRYGQPSIAPPPESPLHTFIFIRMEHWGPILAAMAVVMLLARSLH